METTVESFSTASVIRPAEPPFPSMFDLLMRGQSRLTQLLLSERHLSAAVSQMVGLSVLGFAVHGLVMGSVEQWAWANGRFESIQGHPALWMPIAFALAFTGALGICLPSFYFYTQLAGVDASFRLVTAQALRINATTSVVLLGITPFYAAYALACGMGVVSNGLERMEIIGYVLPFVAGLLSGVRALYRGFSDLADALPRTHTRRGDFLRRMILCWCAIYSVIAPVALWRLTDTLSRVL